MFPFSFKRRKWNMAKFLSMATTMTFHDVLIHNGYLIDEVLVKDTGVGTIIHGLEQDEIRRHN